MQKAIAVYIQNTNELKKYTYTQLTMQLMHIFHLSYNNLYRMKT